jgi:hypothetical protein
MEQQTAVEWLIQQFSKHYAIWQLEDEIKQAKEMEEQQMLEFWNGGIDCTEGGVCFDQYYNETFKNK